MRTKIRKQHLSLALIAAFSFQLLNAQAFDTIQLTNRQSVLNGRAFLNLPATAISSARPADIMSADNNINEETRFIFDIGKMRLVLFATEVYMLGDKNLEKEMAENNSKENFQTKVLTNRDSLFSILSTPSQFDKSQNAILINNLIVQTQENTLFQIDAYINPEAFSMKDEFQKLTEKIFSSITKGDRVNLLNARTETLPTLNDKHKIVFKIPANYCVTIDKKYDFQVYKFHKFQTFAESSDFQQLIIYTGFYPSDVYKDFELTVNDAKTVKGKFLGQPVEWLQFDVKSQGLIDKEQKFPADNIENGLIIHVAMIGNNQKIIDDLTKIAEDVQLTE